MWLLWCFLWRNWTQGRVGLVITDHCCKTLLQRYYWEQATLFPKVLGQAQVDLPSEYNTFDLQGVSLPHKYKLFFVFDLSRPALGRKMKKGPAELLQRSTCPFCNCLFASSYPLEFGSCVQHRKYTIGLNDRQIVSMWVWMLIRDFISRGKKKKKKAFLI